MPAEPTAPGPAATSPAAGLDVAATEPGSITPAQWQRVCALYLRVPSHVKMLPIGDLAGRHVDNLADLSAAEAAQVISELEAILS